MTDGLLGDPARDATPSIGGYAYQLWWSLYAWCRLPTGENLYLEGAEDIDVLRQNTAETIQVKHSSRRVTLASDDVLDALRHWWENKDRNPEYTIHLRFVTTAEIAVEKGSPFGEGGGLRYWEDHAKRSGSDLKPLRDFLCAQERLPEELRRFVATVPDGVLREQLISRISWDTGSVSRLDVRSLVERELIEQVADLFHLPPDDARRTVSPLLDRLLEILLRRDRTPLVRARFLDALEELLTERVARAEIRALRSLAAAVVNAGVMSPSEGYPVLVGSMIEVDDIRPLPPGLCGRQALVVQLVESLAKSGTLVLKGSTGMGKSTLARLVGLTIEGRCRRLDLRGRKPPEIRDALMRGLSILRQAPASASIVIDDLNFDQEPHVYENALIAFLGFCRANRWNVVVTTHVDLPARVLAECEITDQASTTITGLEQDDLCELVVRHGCPSGEWAENWAKVVHATTSGHPLLAHARVRRLKEAGWPSDGLSLWERITIRTDLAAVQREARQRLADDLPSEARTLAYKLSVFVSLFRREHALRVAKVAPAGEFFDRLCGPWVEVANAGYFRLSPLLRGIGSDILGDAGVREVRREICDAIVQDRTLTPIDYAELVFQAFLASYRLGLFHAVSASRQIPKEHEQAIFGGLSWLPLVSLDEGKRLFPDDAALSVLLRDLQFRTALVTARDVAGRVIDAWDREFQGLDSLVPAKMVPLLRSTFLLRVLWAPALALEPALLLRYASEILALARVHPEVVPPFLKTGGNEERQFSTAFVDSVLLKFRGPQGVLALLRTLEMHPTETTEPFVDELRRSADHSLYLMMSIYDTLPPTMPDEAAVTQAAATASELGRSRSVPGLVVAAHRTLAVIEHEYKRDSTKALQHLDAGIALLGSEDPALADYRATILSALGRDDEALRVWGAILPAWQGAEWVRVFSAREAALAASRVRNHALAAEFFKSSEHIARKVGNQVMAVGLIGERALALWRAGERPAALSSLALALSELGTLPDPDSDLQARTLHKLLGHAILWALRETEGSEFFGKADIVEPAPGRLSQQSTDEAMRALPLAPVSELWGLLSALEVETDAGDTIRREWRRRWPTPSVQAQFQVSMADLRSRLKKRQLDDIVPLAVTVFEDLCLLHAERAAAAVRQGRTPPPDVARTIEAKGDFVSEVLAASSLCHVAGGGTVADLPVAAWRENLGRLGETSPALAGLVDAVTGWTLRSQDPSPLVGDADAARATRLAAAAVVAVDPKTPNQLFSAHLTLVEGYRSSLWRREVEGPLERLITAGWTKIVTEQRFALASPRVVVSHIAEACADANADGLTKCARILLAAEPGVSLRLPGWAQLMLRELAVLPERT